MKPFSGGQLLNAETSPFQKALTEYQCIQYALDKAAVMTALCGIRGKEDLQRILGFCDAEQLEKKADQCIKCGHCNNRCPFHVDQAARMEQIHAYFEKA